MKVLMQSRVSLFKVPGGDTILIMKTKEYLEKLGIKVDVSTELQPDLKEYDLVHLFNLIRPQEVYIQARSFNIFWTLSRRGWFALILGLLIFAFSLKIRKMKIFISCLSILLLFYCLFPNIISKRLKETRYFQYDHSVQSRLALYPLLLSQARKQLLWGYGLSTSGSFDMEFDVSNHIYIHNDYLLIFY